MDPFTQRMLDRAEQRSRTRGITTGKHPLSECDDGGVAASDAAFNAGAGFVAMASQQQQQQQKKTMPQQQQQLSRRSPTRAMHASTNTGGSSRMEVVETTPLLEPTIGSSDKVLRQFSALNKENMDVGIEINIMTGKNIEVQVQVEEQDITDDDEEGALAQQPQIQIQQHAHESPLNQPLAAIRDTSRNRLQRLGALYSNNDLSSPIHRTEAQFHAGLADDDGLDASSKKPKQRYGKLAALANTINQWEDENCAGGHQQQMPPPKPDLPSRGRSPATTVKKAKAPAPPAPQQQTAAKAAEKDKSKQLKWDPKVMTSLEAQGFQRRESSTTKLAYDYAREEEKLRAEEKEKEKDLQQEKQQKALSIAKPAVGKLVVTTFGVAQEERKTEKPAPHAIKSGLVSGRMAAFESKASASQQRLQKDPTELSMKERMQLFEKNKGDALMPKAAFGMAPSIAKIRQDLVKKDEAKAPLSASSSSNSIAGGLGLAVAKPVKVHDKVAALVLNATTLSENKIKADIQRQRQEDMQILANRFNKQKEIFAPEQQKETEVKPPVKQQHQQQSQVKATAAALISSAMRAPPTPPPPPPTTMVSTLTSAINVANSKRHSPGDAGIDDEKKRARKSNEAVHTNRLYPVLSDLQSNDSSSDKDNCGGTTATASGRSSTEQQNVGRAERDDDIAAEDSDSYMDEPEDDEDDSSIGICNGSLGREIMQVVQKNEQKPKQTKGVRYADKNSYYSGESSHNSSEASMGIDDYLDEALDERVADGDDDCTHSEDENEPENVSCASRGSKGTAASNSFSFQKSPLKYIRCQTISEEADDYKHTSNGTADSNVTSGYSSALHENPVKSELSVNQQGNDMVTLVHTVSFYRRQQSANTPSSTPVRSVRNERNVPRSALSGTYDAAPSATLQFQSPVQQHENSYELTTDEDANSESGSDSDNPQKVQEKIKRLLDEVCKQQQIIAQTSQALNLCAATVEFSGSTEAVEGERHLLVATHRRQACLDEVQRLRIEKSIRPKDAPKDRGRLTAQDITVPLRQDYIRKLAADTITGHHLVCLLKCNEHVLATKAVPTLPGLLAVKFPDVLHINNVYADFRATLEIYGMTAQREVLPHEVKYHINLNKKGGVKTPKKKNDNRLVMPPVQSPAGPHVVRTPALVQYGFAIFSLREIQRTTWTLTQVLGVSPLDGVVHMKAHCELSIYVEHKGFLTMFEDISGFGAWHRRWCYLNGTVLSYWKYPDDERKKAPMGSIDLYTCSTDRVSVAPRHICARLNTMLLESERPARATDEESLIIVPNGRTTKVRHLLSADTKEEREEWCFYFNKTMSLLRTWGPMDA